MCGQTLHKPSPSNRTCLYICLRGRKCRAEWLIRWKEGEREVGMNGGSVGMKRETGEEERDSSRPGGAESVCRHNARTCLCERWWGGGALERAAQLRPPPCPPYQILTAHLVIFKGICWELSTCGRLTFWVLWLCFTCCCCVQPCWRDNRWLLLSVGFQKTSLTPSPRRTLTISGPTSIFAFLIPLRNTLCVLYRTACLEPTWVCTSVYVQSNPPPPAEDDEGGSPLGSPLEEPASFTSHHLILC